jgi:two-component system invasion response regulator UvrY
MKLLLVDDHEIVRSGLKRLVENYPEINIVGECSSGEDAYNFVRNHEVDFIVMDLSMPGKGGIETTKQIRKHFKDIKILILSMHDNPTLIKQSLDAGANGFILKNDISDDLIKAIFSIEQGEQVLSESIKAELANTNVPKIDLLNSKEIEILKSLAKGEDLKDIADKLNISYKTAANYQTNIKQKLNIKSNIEFYKIAFENNLVE